MAEQSHRGEFSVILRVSYSLLIVIFHSADAWRRQLLPPEPRNVWQFSDILDQNFHSITNINIAPLPRAVESNSIQFFLDHSSIVMLEREVIILEREVVILVKVVVELRLFGVL